MQADHSLKRLQPSAMFAIYKKLYSLLDARERRRGMLVLVLMLLVGLAESAGVASVMPFIAVLSKPQVVQSNRYLAAAYRGLGFTSHESFLLFLGVAVFVVLMGSLVVRGIGIWAQLRFAQQRAHVWACRLVTAYLGQPYEWFLNRNSSELGSSVLAEVNQVVIGALGPGLGAASSAFVTAWLFALLIFVNPVLALSATTGMGLLYGLITYVARTFTKRFGVRWRKAQRGRFRLLQEMLGGIKDVKVLRLESVYLKHFAWQDQRLADAQISSSLITQIPSLAMQGILFGGILLAVLYLMVSHGDFEGVLPTLTVFAFAGYRLMPALQNVYQGITQMRFSEAALDSLCDDLKSLEVQPNSVAEPDPLAKRLRVHDVVEMRDVEYTYPGAPQPALRHTTLRIPARTTVGLVGSTGSGKTTAADALLGLLRPQHGEVVVDGLPVTEDVLRKWQRSVGYVPQQVFLADDTIEANIAFGVPQQLVDRTAVERAARTAELHDFIVRDLPEGYNTTVGERGVRLSGGQRQRIGIARALYRDPEFLILDEATSALDNLTEQAVMDAVHNLEGNKTIVLIAHRLSTVRGCDCIYMLERGRVVASGPYERLVAESAQFRALAELA